VQLPSLPSFEEALPYAVGVLCLLILMLGLHMHGRRLQKHDAWLDLISLRVDNLHKVRADARVRSLQVIHHNAPTPQSFIIPPPLPREGWGDSFDETSSLLLRETRPYPVTPPGAPKKEREE
jgi:hypothetical protein